MPNLRSAKKRLRQDVVRRERNRGIKRTVRNRIKSVMEALEAGEIEKAEELFRGAAQKLDRAGARNIIHRNAAARTKSRLQARIKAAKSDQSS